MCACVRGHFSPVVTLWTVTHQVPLFMGFSRQEYWSGLPCPPAGDLPDPGIKSASLTRSLHTHTHTHTYLRAYIHTQGFPGGTSGKESNCNP